MRVMVISIYFIITFVISAFSYGLAGIISLLEGYGIIIIDFLIIKGVSSLIFKKQGKGMIFFFSSTFLLRFVLIGIVLYAIIQTHYFRILPMIMGLSSVVITLIALGLGGNLQKKDIVCMKQNR